MDSFVLDLVKTSKVMLMIPRLLVTQFKKEKKSTNGTSEVLLLAYKFYLPRTLVSIVGACSERGFIFNFKICKNFSIAKLEISENKDHEGLNPKKLENMI